MLLGIGLNAVLWIISSTRGQPQVISIVVSPAAHDWVYFGLLPPIIFEAGFSMRKRGFFDNLVPILLYAVVGTLIATLAASAMLYACVTIGWIKGSITLGHCLLFAALIRNRSCRNLVSLRGARASMLRNCIFGEATLNDALSLVVFHIVRKHFHRLEMGNGLVGTASDTSLTLRGQPPALFWWAVLSGWAVHSPRGSFDDFAEQQARAVGIQTKPMMAGAAQDTARMSRMLSSHYSPPWRCSLSLRLSDSASRESFPSLSVAR